MKQIMLDRYGQPEDGLRCAEVPDLGAPGAGEVVFDVLAFPINPADISFCRGTYRLRPELPATPGAECVGRVAAIGSGVTHVKPCVLDGPDLAAAVKAQTREAPIRLGLDAVSGRATARLSACLADGGVVCNYGSMTGEDPVMSRSTLISGGQSLVGFILGRALGTRSLEQVRAMYADLGGQIMDGTLYAPVEKVYPIEQIKAALTHVQRCERSGKILVAPNG